MASRSCLVAATTGPRTALVGTLAVCFPQQGISMYQLPPWMAGPSPPPGLPRVALSPDPVSCDDVTTLTPLCAVWSSKTNKPTNQQTKQKTGNSVSKF